MDLKGFWRRIKVSFNPLRYGEIADEELKTTLWHVPLMTVLGFGLLLIFLIPTLFNLVDSIESQLTTFTTLEIDGTISMGDPVELPVSSPKFVMDLNNEERITDEKVRITRKYIYFDVIGGAKRIPVNKILNPLDYRREFSQFFVMLALFALPSLLFFGYITLLVKYAFIIGATALLGIFIVHILLLLDVSVRRICNLSVYAATPMVLIETIVAPMKGGWLVPVFDVFGLKFYGLTTGLYLGLVIAGLAYVEKNHKEERWKF